MQAEAGLSKVDEATDGQITVIYDGLCPFCNQYVQFLRLKETLGTVTLLDARTSDEPEVKRIAAEFDLDEGMVVVINNATYYGEAAVRVLAALTTSSSWLNRLNAWCFSRQDVSTLLYSVLKLGRRITLWVLKVPKIKSQTNRPNEL